MDEDTRRAVRTLQRADVATQKEAAIRLLDGLPGEDVMHIFARRYAQMDPAHLAGPLVQQLGWAGSHQWVRGLLGAIQAPQPPAAQDVLIRRASVESSGHLRLDFINDATGITGNLDIWHQSDVMRLADALDLPPLVEHRRDVAAYVNALTPQRRCVRLTVTEAGPGFTAIPAPSAVEDVEPSDAINGS